MKTATLFTLFTFVFLALTSCQEKQSHENHKTMSNPTISKQDAIKLVKPFYDFLGGNSTAEAVKPSYHADWQSYYSNTGSRNMDETLGFVSGPLAQMVPDLNWEIKEVYVTPENEIIVRGEATGTPAGDNFMGTPIPGGNSFTFMSIDIHELEGGRIKRTYHVEDWLNAIQQVAGN
ncbi:MAG: ester cyclase [Bacteroidia bacterium]